MSQVSVNFAARSRVARANVFYVPPILNHLGHLLPPGAGQFSWTDLEREDTRVYLTKVSELDIIQCECCRGWGHNAYACGTKNGLDRFWESSGAKTGWGKIKMNAWHHATLG